jgi:hypothetical protein
MTQAEGAVASHESEPLPAVARRGGVPWRALFTGLLGVGLICGLTPYNDWIVENTFFTGSYLPLGMVLAVFVIVVLVNAPLLRVAPRWALDHRELAIVVAMLLAASCIPGQGLMRQLMPLPVSTTSRAGLSEPFREALVKMQLPRWLFAVDDVTDANDPVVTRFYTRLQEGESIPWAAWVPPMVGWGVFVAATWGALVAIALALRHQWADNERLRFPLADVQAMLIEPPARGRSLNALFSSPGFWIAAGAVVVVHSLSALAQYHPKVFPVVPVSYDLNGLFSEQPWSWLAASVKANRVYFTFIGITYFISGRVAFSLWFFFMLKQAASMQSRAMGAEIQDAAWADQHLGAAFAFFAGVLFIGRAHFLTILKQMFRGPRDGEARGAYVSYAIVGWTLAACVAVMAAWLTVVGVSPLWTAMIVLFILVTHVVTARIVAQTGLVFIRTHASVPQLYTALPTSAMTPKDVYFGGIFTLLGPYTTRESLLPFTQHAIQVNEQTSPGRPQRRWLLVAIVLALVVGFPIGAASHLHMYYHHSMALNTTSTNVESWESLEVWPRDFLQTPVERHAQGAFAQPQHRPWLQMAIGAGVMTFLQAMALLFSSWPFAPVGYLTMGTYYLNNAWFSILIGWVCKVAVVRFGGSRLFEKGKPFFVGLAVGEALAALIWILVGLVLASGGWEILRIRFLPS